MKPKPVRISWLIKSGRISPMSPVVLIAKNLGISWLMLFDDEYVYGPTPGLVEAADLLIKIFKPRSLADLFGGSGAISKLALRNGVRKVVYVDVFPEAALLNLRNEKRLKIIKGDAFDFLESGVKCDVLIMDPPEELIDRVIQLLETIRQVFRKAALIWIGPSNSSKKYSRILRGRRLIDIIDVWGDSFAVLWKPGLRSKLIEFKRLLE